MFSGRCYHLLSLPQVVGKGLLDVNIFTRLAGPDCRQGMPVIRQGDDHRVDRLVIKYPAEVRIRGDLLTPLLEGVDLAVKVGLVHVAERDDLGAGDLANPRNELMPATANPADGRGRSHSDHGKTDRLVSAPCLGRSLAVDQQRWQSHRHACRHRPSQKMPACARFHGSAHDRSVLERAAWIS